MKQASPGRKMKISFGTIYTVFALLALTFCYMQTKHAALDCAEDTTIVIPFRHNNLAGIKIHLIGNANDSFKINELPLHGGEKIDTVIHLEWYTDTAHIKYKRYKATKGFLNLKVSM